MVDDPAEGMFKNDLAQYVEMHAAIKEKKLELAELKTQQTAIGEQLSEHFATHGITSVNVNGMNLYKRVDRYVSILPEMKQRAIELAKEHGLEDMIAINPSRYRSWVIEQLNDDDGGNRLTDTFAAITKVTEVPSICIRKA